MNEAELNHRLVQFRRDLHRIPELDRALPKTVAYLKEYLSKLPCTIIPITDAGFCAYFKSGNPLAQSCVAFRTDMDALPIAETNDAPYRSEHEGHMHACGHDGHMSIMLGFATQIAEQLAGLPHHVLLVFQAAEETTGGAKDFCASGIFEEYHVGKIYGLHLWPGYPKGAIICRRGDFMASTMVFRIGIEGRSVHVGNYKDGIDALEIAASYVTKVYEMERDEVSADVRRLLRFGILKSGRANNIVADEAYLEGTLRTYSELVHGFIWQRMKEISDELSAFRRCRFSFDHSEPYPAVANPDKLFDEAKIAFMRRGFDLIEPEEPLMVSEDFACYQRTLPGLFLHLGTGSDTPLHSCDYRFDEDVLIEGVRVFEVLLKI